MQLALYYLLLHTILLQQAVFTELLIIFHFIAFI